MVGTPIQATWIPHDDPHQASYAHTVELHVNQVGDCR